MPSWEQFQQQHVLDPTIDKDYGYWNREQWNNWLRTRITNYGSKQINSVVIGTPEEIKRSFETLSAGYSKENFWWSGRQFDLIFMTLVSDRKPPSYDIQKLGRMYFLALIHPDPNRPVHFHGQSPTTFPSGQPPKSFSSARIN